MQQDIVEVNACFKYLSEVQGRKLTDLLGRYGFYIVLSSNERLIRRKKADICHQSGHASNLPIECKLQQNKHHSSNILSGSISMNPRIEAVSFNSSSPIISLCAAVEGSHRPTLNLDPAKPSFGFFNIGRTLAIQL